MASWEGLPCGVQGSCQGEENLGDLGEEGSWPLQGEEQRMELELSFLVEMQSCFVSQALGLLFHPFLVVVSHMLSVSNHCSVSFSQMGSHRSIQFRHVAPQAVDCPVR